MEPIVNPRFLNGVSTKIRQSYKLDSKKAEKILQKRRDEALDLAVMWYPAMLKAISKVLSNPQMRNIVTGGHVSRPPMNVKGVPIPVTSPFAWEPLSRRYAMRRPVSKTFWKKLSATGKIQDSLSGHFAAMVEAMETKTSQRRLYARERMKMLKPEGDLARASFVINYPEIPIYKELDTMIRASFATRLPQIVDADPSRRSEPLMHALLASRFPARPWIGQFAEAAGEAFIERLKALEK